MRHSEGAHLLGPASHLDTKQRAREQTQPKTPVNTGLLTALNHTLVPPTQPLNQTLRHNNNNFVMHLSVCTPTVKSQKPCNIQFSL